MGCYPVEDRLALRPHKGSSRIARTLRSLSTCRQNAHQAFSKRVSTDKRNRPLATGPAHWPRALTAQHRTGAHLISAPGEAPEDNSASPLTRDACSRSTVTIFFALQFLAPVLLLASHSPPDLQDLLVLQGSPRGTVCNRLDSIFQRFNRAVCYQRGQNSGCDEQCRARSPTVPVTPLRSRSPAQPFITNGIHLHLNCKYQLSEIGALAPLLVALFWPLSRRRLTFPASGPGDGSSGARRRFRATLWYLYCTLLT